MLLLVACIGASGILQLIQKILVFIVARFHIYCNPGFTLGADVISKSSIGKGGIIVPSGGTLVLRNVIEHVQGFLIVSVSDVIVGGLHFRRILGGTLAGIAAGRMKSKAKTKRIKPESERVLVGVALLAAVASIPGIAALTVLAGSPGIAVGALVSAHNFTVGRLYFLEFILGSGVVGVQIRVKFLALLTVCFFDGLLVGALGNPQYAVWITHVASLPLCACRALL